MWNRDPWCPHVAGARFGLRVIAEATTLWQVLRYRSNDAEEHHPSEVTTLYPGLQVTTLRAVFRSRPQREALRQLASAVYASRTALTDPTLRPAETRRATDVSWLRRRHLEQTERLSFEEVTLPAAGLNLEAMCSIQGACTPNTFCLGPRRGREVGHHLQIQLTAATLAAAVVDFWRSTNVELPEDLYFAGIQLTDAPAWSAREPRTDRLPIAAALATFAFEGTALISMDRGQRSTHPRFEFSCSERQLYALTGPARRAPVRHRVAVQGTRRVSATLRFASVSDSHRFG